jgi:hypothetical protein
MPRDMAEHLHRHTILSRCLDMLFDSLQASQTKEDVRHAPSRSFSLLLGLNLMEMKEIWVRPLFNLVVLFCHYAFFYKDYHGRFSVILFMVSCLPRLQKHQDIWPSISVSICLAEQVVSFDLCIDTCTDMMILYANKIFIYKKKHC